MGELRGAAGGQGIATNDLLENTVGSSRAVTTHLTKCLSETSTYSEFQPSVALK